MVIHSLSSFSAGNEGLSEMIENPTRFHQEIKDINKGHPTIKGMTGEMVKFYTAVAIVETKNCFLNNDPTACTLFYESLKDPAGHIGFMSFMISAHKTTEYALFLSRGKMPRVLASNIGLMAGMMTQDLLVEFIKDPHVKELILLPENDRYPTIEDKLSRAKYLKNKIWQKTFGNPTWNNDKFAQGASLLSAVALSSGTQAVLGKTTKGMVKLGTRIVRQKVVPKIGFKLGKIALSGGRVLTSVTPIGVGITGVIIFLEWSGVTEKYIAHPIRLKHAIKNRFEAQKKLETSLTSNSIEYILSSSEKVREKFFEEQLSIMEEALSKYYGHENILSNISKRFFKITQYYEWLTSGLDKNLYLENEDDWHDKELQDLAGDRFDYIRGFFCGVDPENSFEIKTDYHGVSIPFKSESFKTSYKRLMTEDVLSAPKVQIRDFLIKPFRVLSLMGTCENEIIDENINVFAKSPYDSVVCPVSFDKNNSRYILKKQRTSRFICQNLQHHFRTQILRSGVYQNINIRDELRDDYFESLIKLTKNYEILRLAYIKRYEKLIQKILLEKMTGQKVDVGGGVVKYVNQPKKRTYDFSVSSPHRNDYSLYVDLDLETESWSGVLPSLNQEISYFKTLLKVNNNNDSKKLLTSTISGLQNQKKSLKELIEFYESNLSRRDRTPDFELMFSDEDWATVARFYKGFILN